jgi:hypothetical protein
VVDFGASHLIPGVRQTVESSTRLGLLNIAPVPATFRHLSATLDPPVMAHLQGVLEAALSDDALRTDASDPQAVYRIIQVWEGSSRVNLAVEYRAGQAVVSSRAFQEAWRVLKRQFVGAKLDDASRASDEP